jgi:hypothetical protein
MILRNVKIYFAEHHLSGSFNQVALTSECEPKPNTTFGTTTKTSEAGLFANAISGQVLYDGGAVLDGIFDAKLALAGQPITVSPDGADAGDIAYFMAARQGSYTPFSAPVGELHGGSFAAEGDSGYRLVRGRVFVGSGNRDATFSSGVIELGPTTADQRIVAVIHVLAAAADADPTLAAVVKSAPASDFAAPSDRITFAVATDTTSELKTVVGPVTDEFFRVDVSIGGTNPAFNVVIAVGIVGK